jgi:amidase
MTRQLRFSRHTWHRVFDLSPFTVCFNLTGQPAIVLPLERCDAAPERTATGFPIAVQLVARYGDEATLFRLAAQLEKARPWFDRKPLVASDSNSESARSAAR